MIGLLRRREMMAQVSIPSENYIRDGLVFYIDGYDFKEGKNWTTRVGDNSFESVGNVTKLYGGGVLFDGSCYMQGVMNQLISVGDDFTVEVCATFNQPIDTIVYYFIAGGIKVGIFNESNESRMGLANRVGVSTFGGCKLDGIDTSKRFTATASRLLGIINLKNCTSSKAFKFSIEQENNTLIINVMNNTNTILTLVCFIS